MQVEITDFPIPFRMSLPGDSWHEHEWSNDDDLPPAHGREFRPDEDWSVSLNVWFRGHPAPVEGAAALAQCLSKPPHTLDVAEWVEIHTALGNMGEAGIFTRSSAQTETIGSRTALLVEGNWLEIDHRCCNLFLPHRNDKRTIQEIYFLAPPAVYENYINAVKQTLASLVWLEH